MLVVDDDESTRDLVGAELMARGVQASVEGDPHRALESLEARAIDVVITDLKMHPMDGVELCRRISAAHPEVPVILLTAHGDMAAAVAALRARAFDFLEKPADIAALVASVERALSHRRLAARGRARDGGGLGDAVATEAIVGASPALRELVQMIERVAAVDATVLVRGESGTGKELVARAIHERSRRRRSRFVALNCAAIPQNLLEAELFGHMKGAFTDARAARMGLFEQARGGTLFLDEIADLHLSLQPKLLRALQERAIRPIGSQREVEVDVRLVTATNADLAGAVAKREFRADLFYRLNVVEIIVPPLRERGDDILLLARRLLEQHARAMRPDVVGLTAACAAKLKAYSWPGNVRELANVIERAVALTTSSHLTVEDLPPYVRDPHNAPGTIRAEADEPLVSLAELERLHIRKVMTATGGNKSLAAQILGVDRRTLYRKDWAETSTEASPPERAQTGAAASLRTRFIEHRQRDVGTLRAALQRADFDVVSRLGHNMKGNGRSYGFPEVSAVGERMETAAEAEDAIAAHEEVVALEAWLLRVARTGAEATAQPPPRPASGTHIRAVSVEGDGGSRRGKGNR